jgi:hypothetical protein
MAEEQRNISDLGSKAGSPIFSGKKRKLLTADEAYQILLESLESLESPKNQEGEEEEGEEEDEGLSFHKVGDKWFHAWFYKVGDEWLHAWFHEEDRVEDEESVISSQGARLDAYGSLPGFSLYTFGDVV